MYKAYRAKWPDSTISRFVADDDLTSASMTGGCGTWITSATSMTRPNGARNAARQCGTASNTSTATATWPPARLTISPVRASHGTPTTEPLERTALRPYKRTGRPEPNEHYVRVRKLIARGNAWQTNLMGGGSVPPPPLEKEQT